jgi:excisionase family DNA binding protein
MPNQLHAEKQDQLLTGKKGAAEMLHVSVRTIERMISDSILPSVRVRGSVRIPVEDVKRIAAGEKPRRSKRAKVKKSPWPWHARHSGEERPVIGGPEDRAMQLVK